jgi:death-on-curing protein
MDISMLHLQFLEWEELVFGFATTQGFSDGNKRTSVVAAERFLGKNGWRTTLSSKLLYVVAIAVARNELDRDGLAEIIRTHIEEYDPPGPLNPDVP